MFSWFLKLLGIEEDKPATSGNSYLNSSTTNTEKNNTVTPEEKSEVAETVEKSEPEVTSEPITEKKEVVDTSVEVADTPPEPEPEPEPEP
ncbi:MAG: hypothetical protein OQL19_19875, partial [Gammaproteobacteria bacterium]|nr:hypothetical protein [Gammaproteobacteria bacterium]